MQVQCTVLIHFYLLSSHVVPIFRTSTAALLLYIISKHISVLSILTDVENNLPYKECQRTEQKIVH